MTERVEYRIDVTGNAKQGFQDAKAGADAFKQGLNDIAQEGKMLRKDLKDMNNEMFALRTAGQEGGKTYQFLAREAGYLRDAQDKARAEIRYYADDFRLLTGGISVMQGLGGAFQAAYGAMNMFGVENKNVLKVMQRFMAVTQVMSGLTQVQNMLRKESAAMLFLNEIRMKTLTVVQKAYTVAVGTTVGAMKALRIALLTTGIGALVVGIGFLIGKIMDWSSATDEQTKSEEKLNEEIKKRIDNIRDLKKEYQNNMKAIDNLQEKNKRSEIQKMRDEGKIDEANAAETKLEKEKLERLRNRRAVIQIAIKQAIKDHDDAVEKLKHNEELYDERRHGKQGGIKKYWNEKKKYTGIRDEASAEREALTSQKELLDWQIKEQLGVIAKVGAASTKTKTDTQTESKNLINAAPRTFNVEIDTLFNVEEQNNMTDRDVEEFRQTLIDTLLSALSTMSALAN